MRANPHHSGFYGGIHPEDQPEQTDKFDVGDPSYYVTRTPNSTRRYYPPDQQGQQIIRRGNQQLVVHYDDPPPQYRKRRFHWLFFVGLAMFNMLIGWILFTSIANWLQNEQNTFTYGMPRTYQTDAVLFSGDTPETPTHVIALNLNGRITIIVMPQGKAQNAKIYEGADIITANPSLVPVTVSFQDVDGSGRKAMLVHVGTQTIIYPNDGKAFQTPKQ